MSLDESVISQFTEEEKMDQIQTEEGRFITFKAKKEEDSSFCQSTFRVATDAINEFSLPESGHKSMVEVKRASIV